MLTKADDYPIHQTPEPIAFSGSDRNFYDRYFFNGYSLGGDMFFAAALGVYPHLNIMDAAFAVRIGGRQYNIRGSRHLNMERMDTHVGPIRIEVVEPLKKLRIIVEDNEHGIAADVLFEGRSAPVEEPRSIRRNGPRVIMDITRMTQLGHYSGWIHAGGQEVRLESANVQGVRDRSWGVRHVGARDPQAMVPAQDHQFHWLWVPAQLEDRGFLFYVNEDRHGEAWNYGMVIVHDDGRVEHLPGAEIDVTYQPGTRWPTHGTITTPGGIRVDIEPEARFFMTGIGYLDPEWAHGINKGPLVIGYDEIDPKEVSYVPPHIYTQAFARLKMTLPDGSVQRGFGTFEALSMGPHARLGFKGMHGGQ
ncbi:MAG TPA: hypothetical protein VF503_28915 [Sphingobium sp.]|uniref:hypothetical protein n=1 Tax=Sphingobium sp. TaxID=1912891 RepID=UPI002ED2E10F